MWSRWCRCWTPTCRPSPTRTRQWPLLQVDCHGLGAHGCLCQWLSLLCLPLLQQPSHERAGAEKGSCSQTTSLAPRTARPRARRARATGTRSSRPTRLRPPRKRGWPAPRWLARPGLPCVRPVPSLIGMGRTPARCGPLCCARCGQCAPGLHTVLARRCEAANVHTCATATPSAQAATHDLER
jgi:hypothetical protein